MAKQSSSIKDIIRNARPLEELSTLRPEFADVVRIWQNELAPELGVRESVRMQTVSRAKTRTGIAIALVALPTIAIMILSGGPDFIFPLAFFFAVLVIMALSGFDWLKVYSMKNATKDLVLQAACRPFGFHYNTLLPDVTGIDNLETLIARSKQWAAEATESEKTIHTVFGDIKVSVQNSKGQPPPTPAYDLLDKAGLLPSHDSRNFEDLIEGERAGAKFALVEAKLTTSGDKSTKTVFQGILIHIAYPQRFSGRTLIARSGWWKRGKGAGDLKKVDLISRELEEAFTVYSSDQVEARALLSPDRMERLIALERHFAGGKLRGLFHEGHMTLALEAPNQFEAGSVFEPLVDPRRFSSALSELGLVCDLIDGFFTREWVQGRI